MNPAHLRAFWQVAKAGGFSRAAAGARVSQPTLSAQVKALETRYGTPLFVRQGRAIRLTPAGRRLLDVAERFFALADEAEAAIAGTAGPTRLFLTVAADGPAPALAVLKAMRADRPDLGREHCQRPAPGVEVGVRVHDDALALRQGRVEGAEHRRRNLHRQ